MTLFDKVYHVLVNNVVESYGVETFVSIDPARHAIVVIRMVGTGIHTNATVESIIRVEDDQVVLVYDDIIEYQRFLHHDYPSDRNVLNDLLNAGISRDQIVVAYRNEGILN